MKTTIYNFLTGILDFERMGQLERNYDFLLTEYYSTNFHAVNRKYPVHLNGKRVLIIRFNRLWRFKNSNMPISVPKVKFLMLKSNYYLGKKADCKFYAKRHLGKLISSPHTGHVFDLDMIESELKICLSHPLQGKPKYRV